MKLIAHYLPAFHPVPENDAAWGEGWTEWDNLRRWTPLFPNHEIVTPHPDIGHYDPREKSVRKMQGELARKYKVYGFCYYHYWFNGKLVFQTPLENMLEDGYPDVPFCLSWANESWDNRWLNNRKMKSIISQEYGEESEWEEHLSYLLRYFKHPNYIRIDGKPVFLVWRLGLVPLVKRRLTYWRRRIQDHGIPDIFIVMTLNGGDSQRVPYRLVDATHEFQPNFLYAEKRVDATPFRKGWATQIWAAYAASLTLPQYHETQFPCVFTGWDNSPRHRESAHMFFSGTPEMFGESLAQHADRAPHDMVFCNAWNEWGEGAVLEPSKKFGYAYLEAVRNVVEARIDKA